MVILYNDKDECSGCSACKEICQQSAISMEADEDGFLYPKLDQSKCIECKLCMGVCDFKKRSPTKIPIATFAAINQNKESIKESSSGGVFVALADYILQNHGIVFGCAYNENLQVEHIAIDDRKEIKKLQGSKYVQSDVKDTFSTTRIYLEEGKLVLYTGTPCQIGGLLSFLGKEYPNLITVDLICHGVPSPTFFAGYLKYLEEKEEAKIICYNFRDKEKDGMGCIGSITLLKKGKKIKKTVNYTWDYYYNYFMYGHIYRKSCYKCKYASSSRSGDFTLGDYWGVEEVHPEISRKDGVSVLLVNTIKAMGLLQHLELELYESTFEKASCNNGNLCHPSGFSGERDIILQNYRERGAEFIAKKFQRDLGSKVVLYKLKAKVPKSFKRSVKKILHKILG